MSDDNSSTKAGPARGSAETLVIIPARMQSTRLPRKPLADIAGKPMIVHVMNRAWEAEIGRVIVATDHEEIFDRVVAEGGEAILTRGDHQSGSDRIWEAVTRVDPGGKAEYVVNLQGDLPTIEPSTIAAGLAPLLGGEADIATLASVITDKREETDPNVVKLVGTPISPNRMRALYFTRATAPWGEGPLYHHIGLYAYRREALARFVSLPASTLEKRERLEQLRALEDGMRIDAEIVDTAPNGVDTQADLEAAREMMASGGARKRH